MGVIQFKGGTGTIKFKGGTIQLKNLGKVANPTVDARWSSVASNPWHCEVTVTNNDTETVEVWVGTLAKEGLMNAGGTLASGESVTFVLSQIETQPVTGTKFTAYAQLRATGRTNSDVVSDESGGFVPVFD